MCHCFSSDLDRHMALLFVATNIFQKFTYRKLSLGGVLPPPPPTFWEYVKNYKEINKINLKIEIEGQDKCISCMYICHPKYLSF